MHLQVKKSEISKIVLAARYGAEQVPVVAVSLTCGGVRAQPRNAAHMPDPDVGVPRAPFAAATRADAPGLRAACGFTCISDAFSLAEFR